MPGTALTDQRPGAGVLLVDRGQLVHVDPRAIDAPIDTALWSVAMDAESVLEINPGALYQPIPPLVAAHQDQSDRILVRGGNRIGKTWWGAWQSWRFADGTHPWRKVRHKANAGLILCSDWKSYRDDVSKVMWQLAPRHLLHPDSDYNPKRGWKNEQIILRDPHDPDKHGHVIHFRTNEQKTIALAGLTVDWGWANEPPEEDVFSEFMTRLADSMGPAWMTFTPINRPVDWLKLRVEGDLTKGIKPLEEWSQYVIELKPENVPHRTRQSVLRQIAGYSLEEYPQRVKAHWEGIVTDRKLQGFGETAKRAAKGFVSMLLEEGWRFSLGLDHGETAGRQVCILVAWHPERHIAWAIDEYVSATRTTESQDAKEILGMLRRNGLSIRRLTDNRGDINSSGKGGAGESVNLKLGRYLAAHHVAQQQVEATHVDLPEGLYDLEVERLAKQGEAIGPVAIIAPDKAGDALKRGLQLMNTAFSSGTLIVDPSHCPVLTRSLSMWQGDAKDEAKHAIDALRYVVVDILVQFFNPPTGGSSLGRRGR